MKFISVISIIVISLFLIINCSETPLEQTYHNSEKSAVNSFHKPYPPDPEPQPGVFVHIDDHEIIVMRPTGGHEWYMEARLYYSGFPMKEPEEIRYWIDHHGDGYGWYGPYIAHGQNYTYISSYRGSIDVCCDGEEDTTDDLKYQMKLNGLWSNYYIFTVSWGPPW